VLDPPRDRLFDAGAPGALVRAACLIAAAPAPASFSPPTYSSIAMGVYCAPSNAGLYIMEHLGR